MVLPQIKKGGSQKKQNKIASVMKNIARSKTSSRHVPSQRERHLTVPSGNRSTGDGYLSDSSLFNCDVRTRNRSFSYQVSPYSPRASSVEPLKRQISARRSLKEKVSNSAHLAYSEIRKMTNKIHTKTHTNCKRRYKKISALVRQSSVESGYYVIVEMT